MDKHQSARLAIFLTFIFGCEIVSSQLLTIFGNEVIIAPDDLVTCKAELECTECNKGRVCISKGNKLVQIGRITCDNTTDKPYCNGGTCSKTPGPFCKPTSFFCPADGVYPDVADCTRYYICANNEIRTNQCPQNNVYDHTMGTCKYKRYSKDCVIINCVGQEGSQFVYPPGNNIYGICLLGKPYILNRCQDYKRYDLNQRKCIRYCKTVGIQPPDDLTDPESCGKYILCAEVLPGQYKPVEMSCAANEGYDPKINSCSKNAPCLNTKTSTSTTTITTTEPTITTITSG